MGIGGVQELSLAHTIALLLEDASRGTTQRTSRDEQKMVPDTTGHERVGQKFTTTRSDDVPRSICSSRLSPQSSGYTVPTTRETSSPLGTFPSTFGSAVRVAHRTAFLQQEQKLTSQASRDTDGDASARPPNFLSCSRLSLSHQASSLRGLAERLGQKDGLERKLIPRASKEKAPFTPLV